MSKRFLIALLFLFTFSLAMAQGELPAPADLEDGWNYVELGEDHVCALGTPYGFFVNPGSSDEVAIHFQVGGGCWDNQTCYPGSGFYFEAVDPMQMESAAGIFDMMNEENPMFGYTHILIPSCNGDVHLGDYEPIEYEGLTLEDGTEVEPYTFYRTGYTNAAAVLDWVYTHYDSPEQVVITGSSAGSLGSVYHTPMIVEQYPEAQAASISESFTVVFPEGYTGMREWGIYNNLPPYAETIPDGELDLDANALYEAIAQNNPELAMGEFTTYNDGTQIFFWQAQGGEDAAGWRDRMLLKLNLLGGLDNYSYFIAGGDGHAIMPTDEFYTYAVGDMTFRDWVASLVMGEQPANVSCEETDSCESADLVEPME